MIDAELCEVVFPYDGLNKDELSLHVGQVISIISKKEEDAGWWKGELKGKVGVFPQNFVKIIEKDDNKRPTRPFPPNSLQPSNSVDVAQIDNERGKKLSKSLSLKHKYGLDLLKKELSETSVTRSNSHAEKKRQAPRPHSLLPAVHIAEVTDGKCL